MAFLLIGHRGSIGSRYATILRDLGVSFIGYDPGYSDLPFPDGQDISGQWDQAIIASPTETHYPYCKKLIEMGKPFLCEKPLSKSLIECEEIVELSKSQGVPGYMVCNYLYLWQEAQKHWPWVKTPKISYNYYRTGVDGQWWDVCQLLYLDPGLRVDTSSPVWMLSFDGHSVPHEWVERSYVKMLGDFTLAIPSLWTLEDGRRMTESVLRRIKDEYRRRDTSEKPEHETAGEDLEDY